MEQEKIASRLILADGTTFNIGTVGVVENVAVKLSAPTSEDWALMKVVVQNITQATSEEYALSALGECKFTIPMGNVYSIVYPVLNNYKQPINATFTATLASRSVEYTYSNEEVMYEQINISAQVTNGDIAELDGKVVSALSDNGNAYAAEFSNGKVTLRIPYGERYKITLPELDGFLHDGTNIQMTAGIPSRFILIHYSEGIFGFFGIDSDGNQYSIEKVEQMVADGEDTSIIQYIGYNDNSLATSDRGDGTVGCGFMFKINEVIKSGLEWSSMNVEYDTTRLPYGSNTKSAYNTNMILEISAELGATSPAANHCVNQKITVGGVERTGLLVAAQCMYNARLNDTQGEYLYNLLGYDYPFKNNILTSNQSSATKTFVISNQGEYYPSFNKNNASNYRVFVVYDL